MYYNLLYKKKQWSKIHYSNYTFFFLIIQIIINLSEKDKIR